ncbi:MAG: L,D-transpeptidase [Candidatus Dormibacterales bacterium]
MGLRPRAAPLADGHDHGPARPSHHGRPLPHLRQAEPVRVHLALAAGEPLLRQPGLGLVRHGVHRGYHLHDAPWRTWYGPGSNIQEGSHGCVVPLGPMTALYRWVRLGDEVVVQT